MQLQLVQRTGRAEGTHPLVTEKKDPHSLKKVFLERDFLIQATY